jgi:GntR family transcriptional regulator
MLRHFTITNRVDRLPLYCRLRDAFAQEIVQKRWSREQAIPTETELAQTHNVSIGTVRKAIELLVADGLLERLQGKGTFVRRPKFNSSLFRFFRFHQEQDAYRVPTSRILNRVVTEFPPAIATAMGFAAGTQAIHLSRLRLIDGQPLLLESIWLPKHIFEPLLAIEPQDYGDLLYPLYEKHCGVLVASAEETLTAEIASAENAKTLNLEPGSLVIVIDRLALGYNRERLEWRLSRGPASKFHYHVEIR